MGDNHVHGSVDGPFLFTSNKTILITADNHLFVAFLPETLGSANVCKMLVGKLKQCSRKKGRKFCQRTKVCILALCAQKGVLKHAPTKRNEECWLTAKSMVTVFSSAFIFLAALFDNSGFWRPDISSH